MFIWTIYVGSSLWNSSEGKKVSICEDRLYVFLCISRPSWAKSPWTAGGLRRFMERGSDFPRVWHISDRAAATFSGAAEPTGSADEIARNNPPQLLVAQLLSQSAWRSSYWQSSQVSPQSPCRHECVYLCIWLSVCSIFAYAHRGPDGGKRITAQPCPLDEVPYGSLHSHIFKKDTQSLLWLSRSAAGQMSSAEKGWLQQYMLAPSLLWPVLSFSGPVTLTQPGSFSLHGSSLAVVTLWQCGVGRAAVCPKGVTDAWPDSRDNFTLLEWLPLTAPCPSPHYAHA